jgi:hypothetical protein
MSATTIAIATRTETVEPLPGSGPLKAALPVSNAAISDRTFSAARLNAFKVQAGACQFKQR